MMIKKVILIAALIILTFWLVGCQTVSGIGGDIQWSAQKTSQLLEGQ
jgi:predicted small secreted protein